VTLGAQGLDQLLACSRRQLGLLATSPSLCFGQWY